jgi:2-polyprenyl-3-methyl-5-hydroxy-6-metoxy-1,4-benzoquinol methylase
MLLDDKDALLSVISRLYECRLPSYRELLGYDPINWLEVGPGSGLLGDVLKAKNAYWLGVEIDTAMAGHMRVSGKNVIHGDFATLDPDSVKPDNIRAAGGFDAAYFSQVLEHVTRPANFLRNVWSCLRPGGMVHLDVPNHAGLTATIRKLNPVASGYGEIAPPYHMMAYSAKTLGYALANAGFEEIEVFACEYNHPVFGLAHSHLSNSAKLRATWKISKFLNMGGNLVALAKKPAQ